MRFETSFVVILAASISISGCSPFQRDQQAADGSFRQAPTSELMAMAERYERQGEYAHAARIYEELLVGDPTRGHVRDRLHALASYGVVSPHVQEALAENIESIVADHQHQLAELEAQDLQERDEVQRHLASMTSVPTPEAHQFAQTAGTAHIETPIAQHAAPAPLTAEETAPSAQLARVAPTTTFPPAPTSASEIPEGPAAWQSTVIRPQQETSRSQDNADAPRPSLTQLDSTGSNLCAANQPAITESATIAEVPATSVVQDDLAEWANPAPQVTETSIASAAAADSRAWSPRTYVTAEAADDADSFCDPVIAGTTAEGGQEAEETEITEAAVVSPMQQAQNAFTVWQVSGDATKSVPVLINLLQNEDAQVVEVTCYLLGELGPAASVAAASLRTLQDSADDDATAIIAAEALVKIEPASSESVDRLVQASRSTDQRSRLLAAMTLASVDEAHCDAVVPALGQLLDDESVEVRSAAALSLGGWGDAAAPFVSKLEELALGDVTEVSEAARIALQCMEP